MRSDTDHETRFRKRISTVRQHRSLTQDALAARAGIPRLSVGRIEGGKRVITLGDAVALCEALGVDLSAMVSPKPLVVTEAVRLD